MSLLTLSACGFGLGVVSTAPLGPSGLSIINSVTFKGWKKGLFSILGLMLAEALYLSIAYLVNSSSIMDQVVEQKTLLGLVFACTLIVLGYSLVTSKENTDIKLPSGVKGVFLLSLFNPSLIIFYLTLYALYEGHTGQKLEFFHSFGASISLMFGAMSVLILFSSIAVKRKSFIENHLTNIKKIFGILFLISGFYSVGVSL